MKKKITTSRSFLRKKVFDGPPWWTIVLRLVGVAVIVTTLISLLPRFSEPRVLTGVEVLRKDGFSVLKGAKVGLITNHTGRTKRGLSTVDLLYESKGVDLIRILSPEHGFRGMADAGESVDNSRDEKTGLPVFSLYGDRQRPGDMELEGIDTLVFDIQDVGVRFYTYITTMAMAMEEAAKRGLRFIVLDRPNPLRGDIIEGDILSENIKRFTGYHAIPTRYGLTPGELARHFKRTQNLDLNLVVIPLRYWKRTMFYDETGLPFIPPSPNIRSVNAAILYPGVGCFEATNISVGRGTETPFEIFGAPWLDNERLLAFLRAQSFPGVLLESAKYTPDAGPYKGKACKGIRIILTDRIQARPFDLFLASFAFLYAHYPDQMKWDWKEIEVVTGSRRLQDLLESNASVDTILSEFDKRTADFLKTISQDLIYKN